MDVLTADMLEPLQRVQKPVSKAESQTESHIHGESFWVMLPHSVLNAAMVYFREMLQVSGLAMLLQCFGAHACCVMLLLSDAGLTHGGGRMSALPRLWNCLVSL